MGNDPKWFQPGYKVKRERTQRRGEHVWTLRNRARELRCELRDDSGVDAGVDVQAFEDGTITFSQRCPREEAACALAALLRQDFLRDGWTE